MRRVFSGRRRTTWYVLADAAALVLFVLIGRGGHGVHTVDGLLRNAVPLLGAWFVVAWLLHTYRRPGWRSLLTNWIVAVPLGLLVRTAVVGSPSGARILAFVGFGLAFTLLVLVLGRLVARLASRAL